MPRYQYFFHSILQYFNNFIKASKKAFTCGIANISDEPFLILKTIYRNLEGTGEVYDPFSKGDAVTDEAVYLI